MEPTQVLQRESTHGSDQDNRVHRKGQSAKYYETAVGFVVNARGKVQNASVLLDGHVNKIHQIFRDDTKKWCSCFKVFHSLAFDYLTYVTSRYCTHSNTYVDLSHHENFATRPSCVRLPHRHHVISGAADLCWRSVRPSILLTLYRSIRRDTGTWVGYHRYIPPPGKCICPMGQCHGAGRYL